MEDKNDLSLSNFKIVLDNQILEINYDKSFKEYESQTINSVIEEVLKKIGQKPSAKTSKDYILYCSCGRPFDPDKFLSKAKCSHYSESDYNEEKNRNEKFVLYEKEEKVTYEKYLTNNEIEKIIMMSTGAENITKIRGVVPKEKKLLKIPENLNNKIKEFYIKKERGIKILSNFYDLNYDEQLYNELLQFDIQSNIIKASLRMAHNRKEEALLIATDESENWDNRSYLFYDNNDVLSTEQYFELCKKEILKEFPLLDDEEEILDFLNKITKKNPEKNSEEVSESNEEEYESFIDDEINISD